MKWTKEEDERLLELIKGCTYYEELGVLLNRTRDSVRGRANHLGVKLKDYIVRKIEKECPQCKKNFVSNKADERKFCSHTCSTIFNNILNGKKRRPDKSKNCLNCNTELKSYSNYCNNTCCSEYKNKEVYKLIENGDTSFSERRYKKFLISKYGARCMECGWCEVHPITGNVPIQLEHIDGNYKNNNLDNLKLLCPNHHSLTLTYGSLNRGNGREGRQQWRQKNKLLN